MWEGEIEGYVVKTLHRELWRFVKIMSFEDAYQEAYVKFMEIAERYSGKVDNPRWFMSLYKVALANRITDFANIRNRMRRLVCFSEMQDENDPIPYEEKLLGSEDTAYSEMLLEEVLEDAPEHVRQVLTLLANMDTEMLSVIAQSWEQRGKRKEDGNEFLCKMLGYNCRQVDLLYAVRHYLEERNEQD